MLDNLELQYKLRHGSEEHTVSENNYGSSPLTPLGYVRKIVYRNPVSSFILTSSIALLLSSLSLFMSMQNKHQLNILLNRNSSAEIDD